MFWIFLFFFTAITFSFVTAPILNPMVWGFQTGFVFVLPQKLSWGCTFENVVPHSALFGLSLIWFSCVILMNPLWHRGKSLKRVPPQYQLSLLSEHQWNRWKNKKKKIQVVAMLEVVAPRWGYWGGWPRWGRGGEGATGCSGAPHPHLTLSRPHPHLSSSSASPHPMGWAHLTSLSQSL